MNFYVLTLFPDLIQTIANTSITGRAIRNHTISVETINIRDFSQKKSMRVDDYPYGGGAGMVMEPEPVFQAVQSAREKTGPKTRVVYLTPQAEVLTQTKVEELAREENLILLCGHYEGIDERALQSCVTDYISIGDYVLTGGELGAAVLIDAVSRFVPGVLHNEESSQFESLQDNLLEYPQYTRPETWRGESVPDVLLSGDHEKIETWRHAESVRRTEERRPDLLKNSYRTVCVYYGDATVTETAGTLTDAVSRYGELRDYNRRKLQKSRYLMNGRDLLLFVFPENAEQEMPLAERIRNLRGKDTAAVLIQVTADKQKQTDQITDTDVFLNDESEWNFGPIRAEMALEKNGFHVLFTVSVSEGAGADEIADLALKIREKALHFHD